MCRGTWFPEQLIGLKARNSVREHSESGTQSGRSNEAGRYDKFRFPTFRVAGLPPITRRLRRTTVEVMLRAGVPMRRAASLRSYLELSPENFLFRTNFRLSSSAAQKLEVDLKFEDGKEAFKSKTTSELLRAYLVLKLSSMDYIVNHNQQLMSLGRKFLGKNLFNAMMKKTFYGHFVGGESESSIKPTVDRLRSFGVKSILDYSAEEDLSEEKAARLEMESSISKAARSDDSSASAEEEVPANSDISGKLAQYQPQESFADRRRYKPTARTYFYLNEAQCEKNVEVFLKSIDAVADTTQKTGLAAIKLTALGRPQLLMQLSEVIIHTRKLFRDVTGKEKLMALEHVTPEQIEQRLHIDKDREDYQKFLSGMDYDKKGLMNLFSWSGLVDTRGMISDIFKVPNLQTGKMEPIISALTDEEEEMFRNMMRRVHTIARHAESTGVRVMVDAEQSYFQPAISRLTVELMRKYNKTKPVIFNTYQCYLKESYEHVQRDVELSKRQNFCFAAKLVRGAYMEQERLRAKTVGYPDPINESYEATNQMYHKVLDYVLEEIVRSKKSGKISVMCATHNENTIRYIVRRMKELGIGRGERLICFGQLLGMCDQVSFPLGQAGYSVYKYVPYGPIDEVMPYLSRRAVENNSLLKKISKELDMLRKEIMRRALQGEWGHRPVGVMTAS